MVMIRQTPVKMKNAKIPFPIPSNIAYHDYTFDLSCNILHTMKLPSVCLPLCTHSLTLHVDHILSDLPVVWSGVSTLSTDANQRDFILKMSIYIHGSL